MIASLRAVLCAFAEDGVLSGVDTWGYRTALPAVVNPVVSSPLQEKVSLRGEWEFVTQVANLRPRRHPGWDQFFKKPWKDTRLIQVPGCWEAQGVGEPGMGNSWDCKWDHSPKPLRHLFEGEGWYRKTVDIPSAWQGKRVWLKVGGVRSQGWFWINNTPVALVDNYCGTYKYDITDLVHPGTQAVVVAAVNNVLPSRKGLFSLTHRFGGLYRDVEIEATPDTRIDDAWVRGDFDQQTAEVHATIATAKEAGRLKNPVLRVKIQPAVGHGPSVVGKEAITFVEGKTSADVVCRVKLDPFHPWSPEQPNLYVAEITLCDGE